jgi:hypothetical protein
MLPKDRRSEVSIVESAKPTTPCRVCHSTDWWWPSDSYLGKKEWICGRCHPNPKGKEVK